MNNIEAYNNWSSSYDEVVNKTRDLEGVAIRNMLGSITIGHVLEIGAGTGKNTLWLTARAESVTCADFSNDMLAKAKEKLQGKNVEFKQMDVREIWHFPPASFDLVTFSLVLEHIDNLDFIFAQARKVLKAGGHLYLGELHPFKQYQGSKARFETGNGVFELECFVHKFSDYFDSARKQDFECIAVEEWFDEDAAKTDIPRLLTMVFKLKRE